MFQRIFREGIHATDSRKDPLATVNRHRKFPRIEWRARARAANGGGREDDGGVGRIY